MPAKLPAGAILLLLELTIMAWALFRGKPNPDVAPGQRIGTILPLSGRPASGEERA